MVNSYPLVVPKLEWRHVMPALRRIPEARQRLSELPIKQPYAACNELNVILQDLADIIAWECAQAFTADYYPGVPGIEPLTRDHVEAVMAAMQYGLSKEAIRRKVPAANYADLPWERQVALAERRRYWFHQFGIDRKAWEQGTFSLWKVSMLPMPELKVSPV